MLNSAEICSDVELSNFAQKLKVCGHPVRLKLLCAIAREEDPCVSELWVCLQQPQPVVSQHLAVLKEKGIVKSEVQGNKRIYSIVDPFVRQIVMSMMQTHAVV
ncbi:MAG TPA: metalloregulator ArsR/SmtB family transcription factor [Spirochaetia bacterium]|nr:metalloregulator ArsR/SmtB family transcription factor [Spirochaetia bacterium]